MPFGFRRSTGSGTKARASGRLHCGFRSRPTRRGRFGRERLSLLTRWPATSEASSRSRARRRKQDDVAGLSENRGALDRLLEISDAFTSDLATEGILEFADGLADEEAARGGAGEGQGRPGGAGAYVNGSAVPGESSSRGGGGGGGGVGYVLVWADMADVAGGAVVSPAPKEL